MRPACSIGLASITQAKGVRHPCQFRCGNACLLWLVRLLFVKKTHALNFRSKAAVNMFNQVLAIEEPEITTIAIRPGVVDTDMIKKVIQEG